MYSSMPATFELSNTKKPVKRERHNVTRKRRNLDKFFDALRLNEKEGFQNQNSTKKNIPQLEAFTNSDSDSDSDDDTQVVITQQMPPHPQSTSGVSGEEDKYERQNTELLDKQNARMQQPSQPTEGHNFSTSLAQVSNYNDQTYNVDTNKWMVNPKIKRKYAVPDVEVPESSSMLQRLNYAIQLLEEKRDEKTNQVTEELILYGLLGIFIIYAIDSFVKVGEYKR